ncbi:amidase [Pelagicoccus sp. SDUM812002]|uniref:amidase n=1 Tax=Pelagicoccus sp. SDUM812002 TaxID=3041266 RepID=UPI0028100093|nr:amidase [Pelagicoccus sp. SDUM812002]MDQ8187781.1 amidase [Pelagicoccus sp. SDUM812002]
MLNKTLSISDWNQLSSGDPEDAAGILLDLISGIEPQARRSVLAALPARVELAGYFEQSRNTSGPLAGVPFFLKDLFDFPGYQTTASSTFLHKLRPAAAVESAFSQALRARGAVFAGKTHLNEFAYGLSGENRNFGDCPHPVFSDKLSGGSSSGSAWSVRTGLVPIATGTDTGGSIRVPAAWCGVFGLRLAPNEWSTEGCFPLAPSFDTAGWFCRSAEDMTTAISSLLETQPSNKRSLHGLSLLNSFPDLSPEFRAKSLDTLERLNAQCEAQLTEEYRVATKSVAAHYSVLQSLEAHEVHKDWLDSEKANYDPVVWQRIDRARHWSPSQVDKANQYESAVKSFFETSFEEYDFVAIPATQTPAISAAEHTDRFRTDLLSLTAPGSFARCPILTIPIQLKSGLSQGLQILYKRNESELPLRVLAQLRATN